MFKPIKMLKADVESDARQIGIKYENNPVDFAHKINKLEAENYREKIIKVAQAISRKNAGVNVFEDKDNARLWLEFAEVLTAFSEHPKKKVAAIAIDNLNNLIGWGINRVPQQMEKHKSHYKKGQRKDFIRCAEQMCLLNMMAAASEQELENLTPDERMLLRTKPHKASLEENKEIAKSITALVTETGNRIELMDNAIMVVTSKPCDDCLHALIAHGTKRIFYFDNNKDFTRPSAEHPIMAPINRRTKKASSHYEITSAP